MKIGIADLQPISVDERRWIDGLTHPFGAIHVSDTERYNVFMLERTKEHELFNPHGSIKYYVQRVHNDVAKSDIHRLYNSNEPLYLPTGTFSVDHGMQLMRCVGGFLHDASGFPAVVTELFGDEYYLHGINYEAIDYFRYLEKERGQYPEYQPQKYIEFMASVLGSKE